MNIYLILALVLTAPLILYMCLLLYIHKEIYEMKSFMAGRLAVISIKLDEYLFTKLKDMSLIEKAELKEKCDGEFWKVTDKF